MEEGSDNGANIIIPVAEIPAQFYLIPFLYYLSFESKPKRSSSKSLDRLAREGRRRNRIKFKGSLLARRRRKSGWYRDKSPRARREGTRGVKRGANDGEGMDWDGTGGEGRGISSPRVEKLNFEGTSRSSFDRLKRFYDHLGLYGGGDKIRVWRGYATLR